MANTQKMYTISIQMDAAQQALADTTKKLAELDGKLEGLDRNSDAAKAIVAEMAKLAKQAESAEAQVQGLNSRLDGLKPGTIGALRQEFIELKAALDLTTEGSEEANAVLVRMGEVKGEIKGLRDEVKALDPEQRINAFNNLAQGVVGAFGIMTVAAETFGIESSTAEEFTKKTQGVIAVLTSLEGIRNALDGETLKSVKGTLALGKAYLVGAENATTASKITRSALLATGLGAAVVLVGLLVSNFDKVKEAGASIYARFKPQFDAISGLIDTVINKARDLASAVTFGLVDDAAKHAVAVAKETEEKLRSVAIDARARQIKILEAAGEDTYQLKRKQLEDELALIKQDNAANIKLYKDKQAEITALDQAEYKRQADEFEKTRLAQEAKDKAAADKRKAQRDKDLQKEYQDFLARNQAVANLQIITQEERLRRDIEAEQKRQAELAALGQQMGAGAGRIAEQQAKEQAERIRIQALSSVSLGDNVLIRVFGLTNDQVDKTKESINNSLAAIGQSISSFTGTMLASGISAADAQIQEAQTRLSELDQQLSEVSSQRQADEQALTEATGARRDYLLTKIQRERTEEQRLAAEKARAAKQEETAAKEKARLELIQQRLTAASTAATNVSIAATAIKAGVEAVAGANAVPFPGNLVAIVAALAATGAAIASAKGLADSFEQGGLVSGPRHSQGGIQLWHRNGAHLGEMEGGEMIINRTATANNLPLLRMINEVGRTRALPPPTGFFAEGGQLAGGGVPVGAVVVQSADLAELVSTSKAMLAKLESVDSSNQQIAGFGPPRIVRSYQEVMEDAELLKEANNLKNQVRL